MPRTPLRHALLFLLATSSLGCASMSKATGSAIAAAAATLAVHATAAVIEEAARGPHRRTQEGGEVREETPCERRRREWLALRVNPRDELPERLACRSNGEFGTPGGITDGHPAGGDAPDPPPAATTFYPSF